MPLDDSPRLALEPLENLELGQKKAAAAKGANANAENAENAENAVQANSAAQVNSAVQVNSAAKDTPMMAQYWRIKQQHLDSLLFYRMGDFYELFFEDAVQAAAALDIALTQRGTHQGKPVRMCGVPAHAHEPYLAKLIKLGFRVAICEQTEEPREAKARRGAAALIERAVVRTITPGTITEDAFLDARKPCVICAVSNLNRGGKNNIAIAWLDLTETTFFCQSIEMEDLPEALARIEPREVIMPEEMLCQPLLFEVLEEYRETLTPMPKSRFDSENAESFLKRHFNIHSLKAFGKLERVEISAAGTLLDYVQLTQGDATPDVQNLKLFAKNTYMQIDATTRKTLEIFQTNSENPRATLIASIDACNSALGARLLRERLAQPLRDPNAINKRLDAVEFFVGGNDARGDNARGQVEEILKGCPDGMRALARIALKRGTPRDLGAVAATLTKACQIKTLLEKIQIEQQQNKQKTRAEATEAMPEEILEAMQKLGTNEVLEQKLAKALLENLPTLARAGGMLSENFAPELRDIRIKKDEALRNLRNIEHNAKQNTNIDTLKVKYNAIIGYFFEIPNRHAAKMQNVLAQELTQKSFTHRQSTATVARYSSEKLEKCAREIAQAQEQLIASETRIYEELIDEVIEKRKNLREAFEAIAIIDLATALARIAQERKYSKPQFCIEPIIDMREARHPVLDAMQYSQLGQAEEKIFIANDCICDMQNFFKLITGPNMAGKSTYLRQSALIIVMAQSGCFVPADKCTIGIVDRLCSRMGAADDIASGKSTFMVEMSEAAAIVRQATENSFLILDEIGRGTSTYDGLAIAWAIVEYLVEKKMCRTLFATHYHELAELDKSLKQIENMHMKIIEDKNNIVFQYKLEKGAAGRSYGIHVAERAGIPKPIVARARQILAQLEKQNPTNKNIAAVKKQIESDENPQNKPKEQKILEQLKAIEPDSLSPKQALEKLYALREIAQEKE